MADVVSTTDSGKTKMSSVEEIIATAIQVPGVKVNREAFLRRFFEKESPEKLQSILEVGPVKAGCPQKQLKSAAKQLVYLDTTGSSVASFLAGLPGGWAMAATIPADILQFFSVALRLAQEVSYLYGADDLWTDGEIDREKVQGQLILYCGVMFGASGAAAAVKALSSALGKQLAKTLPQKALTKTFYYPIVKAVAKAIGAKMTKSVFAQGVSKVVPVVGGVVSGGVTFLSMHSMGIRLVDSMDEANFGYTEEQLARDMEDMQRQFGTTLAAPQAKSVNELIAEAKALLDSGAITEEEFAEMKTRYIASIQ